LEELPRGAKDSRRAALRQHLVDALGGPAEPPTWVGHTRPHTVLIVGVNGSGKTTTAAKLARLCLNQGRRPLLGAADTFRAAGSDQLRIWGERVGCDVVTGQMGADSASVAFDAMEAALARDADVLIVDTAGRMHTKKPLMQELEKIRRALGKRVEGAPHETWIVLDASIGQNALSQARLFHEICPLTGVIVSKLDGSSKAGFLFAVARELGVPVRYAGLGEGADDLVPFDVPSFVDALLGVEETEAEQVGG
jgi:fused signal recognition particle receptor